MHGNVAGAQVVLQPVEHEQAGMIRQADIEDDRMRQILAGKRHAIIRRAGHDAAEAEFTGEIIEDAGKGRIVLDGQHHTIARRQGRAVVGDGTGARLGGDRW